MSDYIGPIVFFIIFILILIKPVKKEIFPLDKPDPRYYYPHSKISKIYQNGYDAAMNGMNMSSPQELYDQSLSDVDTTIFTNGWKQACLDNGAISTE